VRQQLVELPLIAEIMALAKLLSSRMLWRCGQEVGHRDS